MGTDMITVLNSIATILTTLLFYASLKQNNSNAPPLKTIVLIYIFNHTMMSVYAQIQNRNTYHVLYRYKNKRDYKS